MFIKKIAKLFGLLTLSLLFCSILTPTVFAENSTENTTKPSISLGTNGFNTWSEDYGYDYIYYGTWNNAPIKWRVLDTKTNTDIPGLFLLSEELLADNLETSYTYQGGKTQAWCKDFAGVEGADENLPDAFTTLELDTIMATTKSDVEYHYGENYGWINNETLAQENILNGDKVFLPSTEEMGIKTYGFESVRSDSYKNNKNRIAYYNGEIKNYWLRSAYKGNYGIVMAIDTTGWRTSAGINSNSYRDTWPTALGARPAFNLELSSILYTSTISTDASSIETGLTAVENQSTHEQRLTVIDKARSFDATLNFISLSTLYGGNVSINYSGAETGENEYLSAMLTDENENVLYYGRLKNLTSEDSTSGQFSISLPSDLTDGKYLLKIFNEHYTDGYTTNYASSTIDLTLSIVNGVGILNSFKGNLIIVPILKINENNYWCVSYDNGTTWISLGIKATGEQGEKGNTGEKGDQGEKGEKGDTGAQGEKGDTGEKGDKGDTGKQGETGATGAQGKTGIKGDKGEKGDTGDAGEQGAQGTTGAKGDKGEKGDQGAAGINGLTPFIGNNGNWWVGDTDTGVKATAEIPISDNHLVPAVATIGTIAGISLLSNIGLFIYLFKYKK